MDGLVTIIIPCYNAEKYIAETIQSVINQTYKNWELIVVNDGSTDNSLNIIKEFAANDSRVSFIDKENTGVSDTRNKAIALSKGEFIAFLDADDYWNENNLEVKINNLISHKDCDYVFSNMYNADENLNIIITAPKGTDKNILEHFLYWQGDSEIIPGPCSNLLLRRKCIEDETIRFETKISNLADQFFCILLSSKFKGKYIDLPLLKYRILPSSMSRSLNLLEKDYKTVILLFETMNVFKSYRFKQKCISNIYLILAGSWWKDGDNKSKGIYYTLKSIITYPLVIFKLIKKLFS